MANRKKVEIRIVTDGYFDGTELFVDGREWKVKEINFSASVPRKTQHGLRGGKCHFQVQREVDGEIMPLVFYAGAFEKLAEARELREEKEDEEHTDEGRTDQ